MLKTPFPLLLALFSCVSACTQSQNSLDFSLDSLINSEFTSGEPGIAVLVAKKGQIVYKKAFGSANLELKVAMQPDMIFRIGSVTKQFTAIAILQLEEQGKLSLQDSIQKYVDDFPFKGHTITIENLLTHTSGLKEFTVIDHPDPYMDRHELTPRVLIDHFKNVPLEFQPGSRYAYSNSGYVLLGYIIEKVSGKSYYDYVRENVITRAGLTNTSFDNSSTIIPGRVAGYTRDRGFFENTYFQSLSMAYAAGDLMSNVEDLYKWNNAVLAYKVVKKETLEKAFTPFTLNNGKPSAYGYGWFIENVHGAKCIHHEGQISGFIALEKYFPAENIFVSILTNVKSGEDKTDFSDKRFRLFDKIGMLALGQSLPKGITVDAAKLDIYTGVYQHPTDAKRTITIKKEKDYLTAIVSGQGVWPVLFQSDRKFTLDGIANATGEFIIENNKVTRFIISQGGVYEWKKVR